MRRNFRKLIVGCLAPALFSVVAGPASAGDPQLERGTAITDPVTLRDLDQAAFGANRILLDGTAEGTVSNARLFAAPPMVSVRQAIDREFGRYVARQQADHPGQTVGVGPSYDVQLFDRALLDSPDVRFVLAGIVNRMDRAYVAPETCGEIRLIYRLAAEGQSELTTRPPMTLNIVLNARSPADRARACSEIARRWLTTDMRDGLSAAALLDSRDGPLALVGKNQIDRIEINLQIAHVPKSAAQDFRTDYLLKVFRYDEAKKAFEEIPLENQIDRERLLADDHLKRAFRRWLLDPEHLATFDRGTLLIPPEFLANGAIASTPAGLATSDRQSAFGLVEGDDPVVPPVFTESDIVSALQQAANRGVNLQNIRSPAGFERRLNDITCAGCHQTRGIGGFHFPGVDWLRANPSNMTVVPASPHFFGEQLRRRDILRAQRDGTPVDYSRGFADRPQLRGSSELDGSEYSDGWGARCALPVNNKAAPDKSFADWTCAPGLTCQPAGRPSPIGMCFVQTSH